MRYLRTGEEKDDRSEDEEEEEVEAEPADEKAVLKEKDAKANGGVTKPTLAVNGKPVN